MKSVNKGGVQEDDEDEEEEYMEDSTNRKEGSSQKGDAFQKEDGKNSDQKANVTRSKHSVSEQRRRCKINDRFQILKELVPHSDEKKDKASFLLEVIEYIEFLQEKVQKYEPPNQGWYPDRMKLMAWKKNQGPEENTAIKSGGFIFSGKFDDNSTIANSALGADSYNHTETDNTGVVALHPNFPSKAISVPVPLQPCVHTPAPSSSLVEPQEHLISDAENMITQPQLLLDQKPWSADRFIQSDAPSEQEGLTVEGGTISVSSIYSQRLDKSIYSTKVWVLGLTRSKGHIKFGVPNKCTNPKDIGRKSSLIQCRLRYYQMSTYFYNLSPDGSRLLCTLTHALQSSGLDLSQANVSVQLNLGKRGTNKPFTTTSSNKDYKDPSSSNHAVADSRATSSGEYLEQARKRPRTGA